MHEVSLMDRLPLFVQQYHEMRQIMNAENPEFELLWEQSQQTMNNLFVLTADEIGVNRYEQMLGIAPSSEDTLESRKTRILIRINGQLPYTIRSLAEIIQNIVGAGNYAIELDHHCYCLTIKLAVAAQFYFELLSDMMLKIMPANLVFKLVQLYNTHQVLTASQHQRLSSHTHQQVRRNVI